MKDGKTKKVLFTQPRDTIKDLDSLPWPHWESFPIENYIEQDYQNGVNRGRAMPIVGSRGCPSLCAFCTNKNMWRSEYRVRSPENIVREMESYIDQYRVNNFNFQDLTAFVIREWMLRLAQEIIKKDLRVSWQLPSGTLVNMFDHEIAEIIYESGCRNIAFAPETASKSILKSVKKNINLEHLEEAIKIALFHKINTTCFFVIGFPEETQDTLKKTAGYVKKLARLGLHDIGVSKFMPYPGSEIFRELYESGEIKINNDFLLNSIGAYLKTDKSYAQKVTSSELNKWHIRILAIFYLYSFLYKPFRFLKTILKVIFTRREETRYAKFIGDLFYKRLPILVCGRNSGREFK